MTTTHVVKVTLQDGTVVDTWDECVITLDMLSPGSAWTVGLWYTTTRQSTWQILQDKALLGTALYLSIDDAVQLSGVIETRDENESRDAGETMVVSGRDLAGLAIDADADPRVQMRNTTLGDVLTQLFAPLNYSLFLCDAADARDMQGLPNRRRGTTQPAQRSEQVDSLRVRPGEKIWTVADRICRKNGFLIWTGPDPSGEGVGLIVDAPVADGDPTFRFERIDNGDGTFSGNILRGSYLASIRGIPTEVTGFTDTSMTDGQDARVQVTVFNDGLTGPLVASDMLPQPRFVEGPHARTQAAIQREAQREIARAMAHFRVYQCEVYGFSQTSGGTDRLLTINTLAHVRDDRRGIDEDFLITAVTFRQARKQGHGAIASIRMSPKGAIKVVPEGS